jgi:hypothetical protein
MPMPDEALKTYGNLTMTGKTFYRHSGILIVNIRKHNKSSVFLSLSVSMNMNMNRFIVMVMNMDMEMNMNKDKDKDRTRIWTRTQIDR